MDYCLIIDFGSQVSKLIARRVRDLSVYSLISSPENAIAEIAKSKPKAIIFSGGPSSVYETDAPTIDPAIFDLNIPILGICYGQQLICHLLGGKVATAQTREYGKAHLNVTNKNQLISTSGIVWMSHGDKVDAIPSGFEAIGNTDAAPFAAIMNAERKIYALQFHPEVTHSEIGVDTIRNFILNISACKQEWVISSYKTSAISNAIKQIGGQKAICALSGGVDSAVAAAIIKEAIGVNLQCVLVDTGLMRKGEVSQIKDVFGESLHVIKAQDRFLNKLAGVTDPETKRKIIGGLFIEEFERYTKEHNDAKFLIQGTIYPDVIESAVGSKYSKTIKSHHNVGGLPKEMNLVLVEPLRELFKDEVRSLGLELGLEPSLINRHPFPGPGLGIRILGEVTPQKVSLLQDVDDVFIKFLREKNIYNDIWQAFCVLLPCKSVGVMGDGRTYDYTIAIRCVTSNDGMTADVYRFDMNLLCEAASLIVNSVKGVNRVVYDVTSKPPSTIEWE